jgi:enoyl-CoA hydratase/3-hydroxyacyl-CoA dehydrogenase
MNSDADSPSEADDAAGDTAVDSAADSRPDADDASSTDAITSVDDVSTVAVLGAGNMGHGIAEVAALAGFEVTLRDIDGELVQEGYDRIEWSLGKLVEKDRVSR